MAPDQPRPPAPGEGEDRRPSRATPRGAQAAEVRAPRHEGAMHRAPRGSAWDQGQHFADSRRVPRGKEVPGRPTPHRTREPQAPPGSAARHAHRAPGRERRGGHREPQSRARAPVPAREALDQGVAAHVAHRELPEVHGGAPGRGPLRDRQQDGRDDPRARAAGARGAPFAAPRAAAPPGTAPSSSPRCPFEGLDGHGCRTSRPPYSPTPWVTAP